MKSAFHFFAQFFFILSLLLFCQKGTALPNVELINAEDQKPSLWPIKAQWRWALNNEKVPLLWLSATLTFDSQVTHVTAEKSEVKLAFDRHSVELLVPGFTDKITVELGSGRKVSLLLKLKLQSTEIIKRNCTNFNLKQPEIAPSSSPYYLGIFCQKGKTDFVFSISAPQELSWGTSNAFETAGKGERWKQYPLTQQVAVGQASPELIFTLHNGKQKQTYKISPAKKLEERTDFAQKLNEEVVMPVLGIGLWSLGIEIPSTNTSGLKAGLFGSVTAPFFFMQPGISLKFALPFPSSEMGFYDVEPFIGIPISLGWSLRVTPRVYFVSIGMDYNPTTLSYSFNHNSLGEGLNVRWYFSKLGSGITLGFLESGGLFSSETSAMTFNLGYDLDRGEHWQWGVLLFYQTERVVNPTGGERKLQQILGNVVMRF